MLGTYDYPTSHRVFEFVSVGTVHRLCRCAGLACCRSRSPTACLVAIALLIVGVVLAAYAVADLASGIVHFLLDNFGSPETPVIGQKFVKPFRDHHVDPMEMTRGDFIAVNADNVFVCLPVIIPAFFFLETSDASVCRRVHRRSRRRRDHDQPTAQVGAHAHRATSWLPWRSGTGSCCRRSITRCITPARTTATTASRGGTSICC